MEKFMKAFYELCKEHNVKFDKKTNNTQILYSFLEEKPTPVVADERIFYQVKYDFELNNVIINVYKTNWDETEEELNVYNYFSSKEKAFSKAHELKEEMIQSFHSKIFAMQTSANHLEASDIIFNPETILDIR